MLQAKESNINATFLLNDFNMSPAYEKLIEECLNAGVKIDCIGLQSHPNLMT
ncbi:endo-1,4-beta-xylanase [Treponema sp.]|uniref:endo-1,4-beta-xylanase n=1 Tax=Treponema sp. TaxID=166 RepID=UPI0039A1A70B